MMTLIKSILNLTLLATICMNLQPTAAWGQSRQPKPEAKAAARANQDDVVQNLPQSQPMEHPHEPNPPPEKSIDKTLIDKAELRRPDDDAATDAKPASDAPSAVSSAPTTATPKFSWAAGFHPLWSYRADYGAHSFRRFEPEVVGYLYQELPFSRLWLRHGARLGYSDDQPQMPKALRIEESDWKLAVEEGILWNWYIVPSLTAGIGYDWRTIRVKTKDPVVSADNRLNTKDQFWWSYVQAGAGIPIMSGAYMIEPVLRRQHLTHDSRTTWAFGIELTAAF